jgi:hypothetical protein
MHFAYSHVPFGVTSQLVDPLQPTVLAPLRITSDSQASLRFISSIFKRTSASYDFNTWGGINLNVNFSVLQTLHPSDFWLFETYYRPQPLAHCVPHLLVHLPYGVAAAIPIYNNEFQWLPKDRFHIIYHIIATSVDRNSYRIIRVGIYIHFSSKSISLDTMLPLVSLTFQEDNVSR